MDMNKDIIMKLRELGFKEVPSYMAVISYNYGSDFVELRDNDSWVYIEHTGFDGGTMMGEYKRHPFSDVNGLMKLIKRFHGDLTTKPKLWIAREQDGDLYLFNNKPIRDEDGYWVDSVDLRKDYLSDIDRDWFCEVTYENSPREVELALS